MGKLMNFFKKAAVLALLSLITSKAEAIDTFELLNIDLPNRFIKEIYDSKTYLWIGTARGLVRFDKRSKAIQVYTTGNGLPDDFISSIAASENESEIYVGTAGGLAQIDLGKNKITSFTKKNSKLSDNSVNSVYLFKGQLFIGTTYGIDIFSIHTNQWKAYTAIEGLAGGNIQEITSDGNYIWAGGADGISYFDINEDSWYSFGVDNGLTSNLVTSITADSDVVWTGTMGGGLARFDRSAQRFETYTTEEGLIDDNIQKLVDDGKYLWVGTFGGLTRLDKNRLLFVNYDTRNGLTEASIMAGLVQGDLVYTGTDGGGVYTMEKGFPEISLLTKKTGYARKGEIEIYGSILGKNNIKNLNLSYKLIQTADEFDYSNVKTVEKWVEVKNVNKAKSAETRFTVIKTAEMADGKYLVKAEIEDDKGNTNESTGMIIVDNKPPSIDLLFRPPAEGEKTAVVTGTYKELNLAALDIKIGNKTVIPEISRQSRRFRFNYPLDSAGKIFVTASDTGLNETKIERDFIIDRDPPELEINPVDIASIKGNIVEITGTVKDANFDRIVILPDNVEAVVKATGADSYTWSAKTQVKKEGKYAYQVSASDKMTNSIVKTVEIDFVSKITIVELRKENLPEFTLKNEIDFSGIILGPPLKDFFLYNKTNDRKTQINLKNDKSFSVIIPLVEGKNEFKMEKIFSDGHTEEDSFVILYSIEKVKASLDLGTNSFREKLVTLRGRYDQGIRKVLVNNKPVNMNEAEKSFTIEHMLNDGKNNIVLSWFDELNRLEKMEYTLHLDTIAPDIYIRSLPDKTSLKTIKVKGKVTDNVASLVSGYPAVEIQKLDMTTGEFEAIVKLEDGSNNIHFSALDPAGNKKEVLFQIEVDKSFPEKEFKETAMTDELDFLRNELEKLRKELQNRPVIRSTAAGSGGGYPVRVNLPDAPGLYLVPMAGKIKSYELTARVYLGNESLGVIIAKYNGKNPQEVSRVLVPSPRLFNLISTSKNSNLMDKIIQSAGMAFQVQKTGLNVQKSILQYLIRSRSFKEVVQIGNDSIIMTNTGMGIVISGNQLNGNQVKTNAGVDELIVGYVTGKGINFLRY
jgi:hypothetical protein